MWLWMGVLWPFGEWEARRASRLGWRYAAHGSLGAGRGVSGLPETFAERRGRNKGLLKAAFDVLEGRLGVIEKRLEGLNANAAFADGYDKDFGGFFHLKGEGFGAQLVGLN